MKFIVSVLLTALLSYTIALYKNIFPWYGFVFCAFIVAVVIPQKSLRAFITAFIALFLLWGIEDFILKEKIQHIPLTQVTNLLPSNILPEGLIAITAGAGGLFAGIAALLGSFLRKK